ncbi:MAG: anthranilate synthase component I family protein [Bacteroidetes bacterium]|nr:anthranilate synthase component I family protein [Bacteroidota bacterium]
MFGYFSYDLKNDLENLSSENPDRLCFPNLHFFIPETVVMIRNNQLQVLSSEPNNILDEIISAVPILKTIQKLPEFQADMVKEHYIDSVKAIQRHIIDGDVYELNFCQEFHTQVQELDTYSLFHQINQKSIAPFSAFYRSNEHFILCTSPERFLQKRGTKLISQPIKGTRKRGDDEIIDNQLKNELRFDEKEIAENVMIVDLVRNDLARISKSGTTKVEELFKVHTFPALHHLISTISSEIEPGTDPIACIRTAFPMGSMTGAPKIRAMELIEKYETVKRGVFSGALGYFTPEDDFDFNVIIRSLMYNAVNGTLSVQAGGAITYDSDPEKEYQESLLKILGLTGLPINT